MAELGLLITIIAALAIAPAAALGGDTNRPYTGFPPRPWVIAHRGASAYAPENTVPAFRLAIEQGAAFVELDVQMTRDGRLVCLHDETLERTTDVEQVFPDRFVETTENGKTKRGWPLRNFTLDEVRRLDAGSWFAPRFAGTRIPTLAEAIESVRGRCGLFVEIKSPQCHPGIEARVFQVLRDNGLDRSAADPKTPIVLQSFSADSLRVFRNELKTPLPIHLLFGREDAEKWLSADGLVDVRTFATGLSPHKSILEEHADGIARARAAAMPITPWTFRAGRETSPQQFRAEMTRFAEEFRADGLITDNPDLAPATR
jgi:glycerophosphoryl diester phosphodiesterase